MIKHSLIFVVSFFLFVGKASGQQLEMEKYFAWCIVPFDNQNRTPAQRVDLLKELGFTKYAYDWRVENLSEMAEEIKLARQNDIEIIAVWMWLDHHDSVGNLSTHNRKMLQIVKETQLNTQLWVSFPSNYFEGLDEPQRLEKAISMIGYVRNAAEKVGCKVALYNHGGWFGRPENLIKIAKALAEPQVGIVFNFHHAHDMIDEFPELLRYLLPRLWAVNLNGMDPDGPKILPIGAGKREAEMLAMLKIAGFDGPFGILGHVKDEDVEVVLKRNISGLKDVLRRIK